MWQTARTVISDTSQVPPHTQHFRYSFHFHKWFILIQRFTKKLYITQDVVIFQTVPCNTLENCPSYRDLAFHFVQVCPLNSLFCCSNFIQILSSFHINNCIQESVTMDWCFSLRSQIWHDLKLPVVFGCFFDLLIDSFSFVNTTNSYLVLIIQWKRGHIHKRPEWQTTDLHSLKN
jgi:hypothetical protein